MERLKCIRFVDANNAMGVRNFQPTPCFMHRLYGRNEILRKFADINTHGTVFALSRCLYQKEARGMERLKMHSLCR